MGAESGLDQHHGLHLWMNQFVFLLFLYLAPLHLMCLLFIASYTTVKIDSLALRFYALDQKHPIMA